MFSESEQPLCIAERNSLVSAWKFFYTPLDKSDSRENDAGFDYAIVKRATQIANLLGINKQLFLDNIVDEIMDSPGMVYRSRDDSGEP